MLTYRLTPGGYQILSDGKIWIDQPFNPNGTSAVPYTPEEAEAAAQALIAELSASVGTPET